MEPSGPRTKRLMRGFSRKPLRIWPAWLAISNPTRSVINIYTLTGNITTFDISAHTADGDTLLTVADAWFPAEIYTITIDGKELGRTHGALTLPGDEKYSTEHIMNDKLYVKTLEMGITHGAYWGTFKVPKGLLCPTFLSLLRQHFD